MRKTGSKDEAAIRKEFRARQTRQIIATAAAMFLVLCAAVLHRRPDLFGEFSRGALFGLQAVSIAAFLGYAAYNWRCPACGRHLGGNVFRTHCEKCRARLQ